MSVFSFSVAAAATSIASCPSVSPSSSDHFSLTPILSPLKLKRLKAPKFAAPFPLSSKASIFTLSPTFPPRAAFDGVGILAETEVREEEEEGEEEEMAEEEEDEEDGVASLGAEDGRLFVGNLPFTMTADQLSEIFSEAGRVVSTRIIYDRVTDRSRGFAFVKMKSVEEANEAIRLFDGSQIGGRTVKVNFPEVPRGGEREVVKNVNRGFIDSPHKLYVGNLSWGLISQRLREAFADQPGFLSAKVIYDRDMGRSRGFGFTTFASADDMESALNAMNGVEVDGRPLRLSVASSKASVSPQSPTAISSVASEDSDLSSNGGY